LTEKRDQPGRLYLVLTAATSLKKRRQKGRQKRNFRAVNGHLGGGFGGKLGETLVTGEGERTEIRLVLWY